MKDISKDLKEFFKKKGLTQQQIADILGVSQAYIGYLIRGEKPFGKKQAEKFSNLFGFNGFQFCGNEAFRVECCSAALITEQ